MARKLWYKGNAMKKTFYIIFMLVLTMTLVSCTKLDIVETKIITPVDAKDLRPILSFGNQKNQIFNRETEEMIIDKEWVYFRYYKEGTPHGSEEMSIVKFPLHDSDKQETIYESRWIMQISVLGDWVYFLEHNMDIEGFYLCKIKKDGSNKTELISNVDYYILTEDEIYWQDDNELKIQAMGLDGRNKRDIMGSGHGLAGIDEHGWLYFQKYDKHRYEYSGIYRIKLDGSGREILLNPDLGALDPFLVEDEQLYFYRWEEGKISIIKKAIDDDKEEEIIYSYSGYPSGEFITSPMNKEGDELFFGIMDKVYKINEDEDGEKMFVGDIRDSVYRILLYDRDVLFTNVSGNGVFIKEDGTVVEFNIRQ